MVFLTRKLSSGLTAAMLLLGMPLSAQQRTDLPPPESSRAPLLTRGPADSIRYQTAHLRVMELVQALQTASAPTIRLMFEQADLRSTSCGSLDEAFSRIAPRARKIAHSDGSTSLALFFDNIKVSASDTAQVVTAELVLMLETSAVPLLRSVTLVMDAHRAIWTQEAGLFAALCQP